MNTDLLLTIADMIEAKPEHFSMSSFIEGEWGRNFEEWFEDNEINVSTQKCDTVACIGGWANILTGNYETHEHERDAAEALDIDKYQGARLFYPDLAHSFWREAAEMFDWSDEQLGNLWGLPAEEYAKVLRALADGDLKL